MRTTLKLLALAFVIVGAASCGSGGGGSGSGTGSGVTQVAIAVTGTAPKGASITYGSDSTSYTGHFPLQKTLPLYSRAGSYRVSAQLKGGGDITCKLTIGSASSVGHASGTHKICSALLTNDYQGGWH